MSLRWAIIICALLSFSARADLVYQFEGTITQAQWNGLITPGMKVTGGIVWPDRPVESSFALYRESVPPAAYWFSVAGLTFEADLSRMLELMIYDNWEIPGLLPDGNWTVNHSDAFAVFGRPLALPGVGPHPESSLRLWLGQVALDGGMPDFLDSAAWPRVIDLSRATEKQGSVIASSLASSESFYAYFDVDRIERVQSLPEPGSIVLVTMGLVSVAIGRRSSRRG